MEIIKIQKNIRGFLVRQHLYEILLKRIFIDLNVDKFTKMINSTNKMSDDNMYRFIKSPIRERFLAELLKCKYVGNISKWETDIIYPKYIEDTKNKHLKLEIKSIKGLYTQKGDTHGIILKNGRGEGTKIKDLLISICKNIFILIDTKEPYSIAYCKPTDFIFYTKNKKDGICYKDLITNQNKLEMKTSELKGYLEKKDIHYLYNNLSINDFNDNYDPIEEMFKKTINYYNNI